MYSVRKIPLSFIKIVIAQQINRDNVINSKDKFKLSITSGLDRISKICNMLVLTTIMDNNIFSIDKTLIFYF